jgi:hypothetical protein
MTTNIIVPTEFNEKFVLYLNSDGQPVDRTLREMTAGEVLQAIEWHEDEADTLADELAAMEDERAAARATLQSGKDAAALETLHRGIAAARKSGKAAERSARLMTLVAANIPQWERHPGLKLSEALRRYWPHGRAAA